MKREVYIKHVDENKPERSYYEKMNMAGGFIVGHTPGKELKDMHLIMEVVGDVSFETAVDDIMSAVYHIATVTWIENKSTEPARDEIYKRMVQAFSLVIDKFHPKAKDMRKDIMTEDELKKIEELVKKDASHKQG